MSMLTRRSVLGAAVAAPAFAAKEKNKAKSGSFRKRSHPLEGIARENLKITDIKVTIMSYELKDKEWVTATQLIWKSDSVLIQIFTDKGIVGIGESSPYGNPEYIKKTVEESIKPALLGKNPFDVEHLVHWLGRRPGPARRRHPLGGRGRGLLGHHR